MAEIQRVMIKVEYTNGKEVVESMARPKGTSETHLYLKVEKMLKGFFGVDDDSF